MYGFWIEIRLFSWLIMACNETSYKFKSISYYHPFLVTLPFAKKTEHDKIQAMIHVSFLSSENTVFANWLSFMPGVSRLMSV